MNLTIHPINKEQRDGMPRFNNVEKHGLGENFWDKAQETLSNVNDTATTAFDTYNTVKGALDSTKSGGNNSGSNYNLSLQPRNQNQMDTIKIVGSVGALIAAAFLAKKLLD